MKKILLATSLVFGACSSTQSNKKQQKQIKTKFIKEFILPHATGDFYNVEEAGYYLVETDSKDKVVLTIKADRNRNDAFKFEGIRAFISSKPQKDESKFFENVSKWMVLYLEKQDELAGWLESSGDLEPLPNAKATVKLYKVLKKDKKEAFIWATNSVKYYNKEVPNEQGCKSNYSLDKRFAKFATPRKLEANAMIDAKTSFDACMQKFAK